MTTISCQPGKSADLSRLRSATSESELARSRKSVSDETRAHVTDFRAFSDSRGVLWTVLRVEPEPISLTFERLREKLAGVQIERRCPWLLFESAMGERRRLAPVPEDWDQQNSEPLLRAWCTMAASLPPAPV